MKNKEYLITKTTLTGLVKFMSENFKKQSGTSFTVGDVQQYITRQHLPGYLGKNVIEKEEGYTDIKLYKIVKNVEKK